MTGRTEQEIRADLTLAGRAIVDHGANPPDDVMWRLAGDVLPLLNRVQAAEAKIAAVEAIRDTCRDEAANGHGAWREINARRADQLDAALAAADTPTPPWEDVDKDGIRRPVTPTPEATTDDEREQMQQKLDNDPEFLHGVLDEVRALWKAALEREGNLTSAVADVVWKATQFGETEDGDTYAYIVPKGAIHRLVGVAQQNGAHVPVAFRSAAGVGDTGQADEPQRGCRYDGHGHCPPGTPGCDCWTPGVDRPTGPAGRLVPQRDPWDVNIEQACKVMHDAYERAAAGAGWETQQASRKPWGDVPEANKATMRAAVAALIDWLVERVPVAPVVPQREDDEMFCPNFKRHCDVGARWQEGEPLYKKERRDWLYDQGFKSDQASCDYCNPECPTCNRRERREHAAWIAGRVPVADEGEKPEPRDFHDALVRDERRAGQVVPQQPTDQTRLQARMLMAMVDSKRVWAVSPEGNPDCTLPVLISVSVAAEICAGLVAGRVPVGDEGEAR